MTIGFGNPSSALAIQRSNVRSQTPYRSHTLRAGRSCFRLCGGPRIGPGPGSFWSLRFGLLVSSTSPRALSRSIVAIFKPPVVLPVGKRRHSDNHVGGTVIRGGFL